MLDIIFDILAAPATLIWIATVFFGVATFLLAKVLIPDEKRQAERRMLGQVKAADRQYSILLLKLFRPFFSLIAGHTRQRFNNLLSEYRSNKTKHFLAAGIQRELDADEFLAFKFLMIWVFLALSHSIATTIETTFLPLTYLSIAIAGYFGPDLWLRDLINRRQRDLFRHLPYAMDILTLSVEAGLDFIAAIKRMTTTSKKNALMDEFELLQNEISLGSTRSDALRSLARRVQMDEMNSFTTLLIQAERLGAQIGPVLRAQADSLRSKRFQKAEIAGAKASQLVLFPMIFCIFPATFIILLGPLIVKFLSQGFGSFF